jgi:hypothetical protein
MGAILDWSIYRILRVLETLLYMRTRLRHNSCGKHQGIDRSTEYWTDMDACCGTEIEHLVCTHVFRGHLQRLHFQVETRIDLAPAHHAHSRDTFLRPQQLSEVCDPATGPKA